MINVLSFAFLFLTNNLLRFRDILIDELYYFDLKRRGCLSVDCFRFYLLRFHANIRYSKYYVNRNALTSLH